MNLLERLSIETGLREADVRRIMLSAPSRYKDFYIKKRSGGMRLVSQPAREVKLLQRGLNMVLLNSLPMHEAATAYREQHSIRDNAAPHAGSGPILKMDFKDFFPSITSQDWTDYCHKTGFLIEKEEIYLTARLLFRKVPNYSRFVLAIGAPSSPALSNALMYDFDVAITSEVAINRVIYTRYADDLTFSAPRTGYLTSVKKAVRKCLGLIQFPTLRINEEKTVFSTNKYSRRITGLTLSNDGRVTIGRSKKREVFVAVHHALTGQMSPPQLKVLAGLLAHINAVEPEFLDTLRKRYGGEIIQMIQNSVFPKKLS